MPTRRMNHVSLFTGVGGIDLAAEWAGFTTIAQVERDPWRRRVLKKHWPAVHRIKEIQDFPDRDYEAIILISGGFPCPPYSQAGKRRGKEDPHHLWPQMARVIRELKPTWVVAENVAGAVSLVLDDAITDLEKAGYSVRPVVLPALALKAWHERQRLFIVAHLNGVGRECAGNGRQSIGVSRSSIETESVCHGPQRAVADSASQRCKGKQISARSRPEGERKTDVVRDNADSDKKHGDAGGHGTGSIFRDRSETSNISRSKADANSAEEGSTMSVQCDSETTARWRAEPGAGEWWQTERGLVRVVHGLSRGLDRHRRRRVSALGDSCVPTQVYPILRAIANIELEGK